MSSRKHKGRGTSRPRHDAPSEPTPPASSDGTGVVAPDLTSDALRSVVGEVVARTERAALERALPPSIPVAARPPATWLAAAGLSWIVVLLTLMRPPAFLDGPQPEPYAPPAALGEASDRYALWLAAGRIERFTARQGRLPSFLGETGFEDPRVQYRVTGERTWVLELGDGEAALRLASNRSRDDVLGDALTRLQQGS